MKYRLDIRDLETFKKDIRDWHAVEREAAKRFCSILTAAYGALEVAVDPTGCDMSGEYLPDHLVNTQPDFIIRTNQSMQFGEKKDEENFPFEGVHLEIKAAAADLQVFHIKKDQVESYLTYPNCMLLMLNGVRTENPIFTLIRPSDFKRLPFPVVRYQRWGGKLCYRLYKNMFRWEPFRVLSRYPADYFKRPWVLDDVVRTYKINSRKKLVSV